MSKNLHEESVVLNMVRQHLRDTICSEKSQDVIDYASDLYQLISDGLSKK